MKKSIYDFENYCAACDNFPGNPNAFKVCPFKDIVKSTTKWKELKCKDFWD